MPDDFQVQLYKECLFFSCNEPIPQIFPRFWGLSPPFGQDSGLSLLSMMSLLMLVCLERLDTLVGGHCWAGSGPLKAKICVDPISTIA